MWYGAGVCGFVGGERVTSFLLCSPLAVGRRGLAVVRGGARHSFVSESLHVARASFFGPRLGGVSVNAAEATKGVAVCSSTFLYIEYTPKCAKGRRSRPPVSRPRSHPRAPRRVPYHTTRRQRPGARGQGEARRGPTSTPESPVTRAATPRVCREPLGTVHTTRHEH